MSTHMIIMDIRQAIVTEVCLVDSIITIIRRTGICEEQMEDYLIRILTLMEMENLMLMSIL